MGNLSGKTNLAFLVILLAITLTLGISLPLVNQKQLFVKICIGKILPKITEFPKESIAIQGNQRNITCDVKSCLKDETRFQWLDFLQSYVSQVEELSLKNGVLTIFNVPRSAKVEYEYRGVDEYGEVEASLRLEVQVPPRIVQLGNLTREENSSATFECIAEGVPQPNLTIRKDGANVLLRSGDDRIKLVYYDKGGYIGVLQLTIAHVKRSDDGLYSCQASNAAGLAVKTGRLEVQFGPDMSLTPASVVKSGSSNPGNLTCIAEANPNASLVWKFRGVEIDQWDERYQILGTQSQSSLLVRTEYHEVFGEYTCEAKNRLGKNSTTITLEEVFAPGTVKFSVAARNGAGEGPWYSSGYIMPAEKVPDAPRWFLKSLLIGPDRVKLEWNVSEGNGRPVLRYEVRYFEINVCDEDSSSGKTGQTSPVIEWTTHVQIPAIELTGLRPDTCYSVGVRAVNEIGKSPFGYTSNVLIRTSKSDIRVGFPEFLDLFKWIVRVGFLVYALHVCSKICLIFTSLIKSKL